MQLAGSLRVYLLKGDICENTLEDDYRGGSAACVLAVDDAACRCLRYAPFSGASAFMVRFLFLMNFDDQNR
jgi:hypothetical protein